MQRKKSETYHGGFENTTILAIIHQPILELNALRETKDVAKVAASGGLHPTGPWLGPTPDAKLHDMNPSEFK